MLAFMIICYDTPKPTRLGLDQLEPVPLVAARESCEVGKGKVALSKTWAVRTADLASGRQPTASSENSRSPSQCGLGHAFSV